MGERQRVEADGAGLGVSGPGFLRWQWEGYPRYHRSRINLLIHIVAVPVFMLGNITLVVGLVQRSWMLAGVAIVVTVTSIGVQGQGHRREPLPPERFAGPLNAVSRIFCEQWVTFPRFVLSGGWASAFRKGLAP
jgi:hypothetical protein